MEKQFFEVHRYFNDNTRQEAFSEIFGGSFVQQKCFYASRIGNGISWWLKSNSTIPHAINDKSDSW